MMYAICAVCGERHRLTQPTGASPPAPVIDMHGSTRHPAWVERCPGTGQPAIRIPSDLDDAIQAPPMPPDSDLAQLDRELADELTYETSFEGRRTRTELREFVRVALEVDLGPNDQRDPIRAAARRACGLEIERRRRALRAPCEVGVPRPLEPDLPADLTPDEHNQRVARFQRALERWHGA